MQRGLVPQVRQGLAGGRLAPGLRVAGAWELAQVWLGPGWQAVEAVAQVREARGVPARQAVHADAEIWQRLHAGWGSAACSCRACM